MTEEYANLEGFNEDEDLEEGLDGGVREPKKPILPSLSGGEAKEIEREEIDLLLCANE